MALHHIERLVSERGITMLAEDEQQVSDGGMTYTVTLFHQGSANNALTEVSR